MGKGQQSIVDQMRANPAGDWSLKEVLQEAERAGLTIREPKRGSHYTVSSPYLERIETVPYGRPVRPVYVRKVVAMIKQHLAAKEREK